MWPACQGKKPLIKPQEILNVIENDNHPPECTIDPRLDDPSLRPPDSHKSF